MSAELRIVCRPDVAAGLGLASLPTLPAATAGDAAAIFRGILGDPAIGVVLMEDVLHDHLPDDLRHQIARRATPLVVPFPGPAWTERPESAESYIVELLRQVIGYRVRLR